ncbi:MAG: hypothetical protein ACXVRJ_07630 [Gaiellaceae bacterium]
MKKHTIIGAFGVALVAAASLAASSAAAPAGPDMCLAFCQPVRTSTPAQRADTKLPAGRDEVRVSLGTYPPEVAICVGAVCAVASDFDARYVVRADRINVGQALVVLFRIPDDTPLWSESVPVTPYGTGPGGWLSVQSGILDCAGGANTAPNAYFRVKDDVSGRWSIPQYVTTGCATS